VVVVGAVLIVGVPVVFGIAAVSRLADDLDLTRQDAPTQESAPRAPQAETEVVVPDLDGLEGVDAELGEILVHVNRSEEQMLATQERFAAVLQSAGEDRAFDEVLDELSSVAGEGQRELQSIRSDLTSTSVDSSRVREVRERYLAHLDAWVRYFVAIEADPSVLTGGSDQGYLTAIDTTGDAFARAVREDLPDGIDESVRTFAEQIVERGFPERQLSDDDTV
jgi:hypothetical protein